MPRLVPIDGTICLPPAASHGLLGMSIEEAYRHGQPARTRKAAIQRRHKFHSG